MRLFHWSGGDFLGSHWPILETFKYLVSLNVLLSISDIMGISHLCASGAGARVHLQRKEIVTDKELNCRYQM